MKKLFISAIPICLVSYILFGISVAILGQKPYSYGYATESGVYEEHQYINETVSGVREWTLMEAMPNINLRTSGIKAYVIQSEDEYIHLHVSGNNIAVMANGDNDTLDLEIHPPGITFGNIANFGQILWREDIFHGSPSAEVVIAFPKLIYDSLDIEHGSGTLMVDGLHANDNDIDIGSGRFEFSKSDQYTANYFGVNLSSGSALISNIRTNNYEIDIGSGNFNFNGLSGSGSIDMGSGKGSIAYADSPQYTGVLDMGSGNLTVYLPNEYGCDVGISMGSGSVSIDAYGVKKTYTEDDYVMLGNSDGSESCFGIDMGSGKVNILNTSAYTAPAMFEGRPDNVDELGAVTGIVINGSGENIVNSSSMSVGVTVVEPEVEYSWGTVGEVTVVSGSSSETVTSAPIASEGYAESSMPSAPTPQSAPTAPTAPSAPTAPTAPTPPTPVDAAEAA